MTSTNQPHAKQGGVNKSTPKGDKRRQDLIVAAYQIIAESGFEGLRVRDVAERIGVNIATLHYYFADKETLVRAVVEYLLHQFLTLQAPAVQTDLTPIGQLRGIFADLHYQLEHEPAMFAVLNELHLRAHRDPAMRDMLSQLNNGWQQHIEQVCVEGIQQRQFRADLDPQQAASMVIALIKGISVQAVSHLDSFDINQVSAEVERWFVVRE